MFQGDYNVIGVDWTGGNTLPYTQATANTRVVGAVVAQFITFLEEHTGLSRSNIHIIGHSLGAHTAGYAGERLPGLARITGNAHMSGITQQSECSHNSLSAHTTV